VRRTNVEKLQKSRPKDDYVFSFLFSSIRSFGLHLKVNFCKIFPSPEFLIFFYENMFKFLIFKNNDKKIWASIKILSPTLSKVIGEKSFEKA